jgi:hypothetical protein
MLFSIHNPLAIVQSLFQHLCAREIARPTAIWLMLIALSLTVTACGEQFADTAAPEPTRLLSFVVGKLVKVDGCLRVHSKYSGTSYLLAWPPDFTVNIENDTVQIIKRDGEEVVLRIGGMVRVSGGEVKSTNYLSEEVRQKLPPHCRGPYWVVGIEISPMEAISSFR